MSIVALGISYNNRISAATATACQGHKHLLVSLAPLGKTFAYATVATKPASETS